MNCWVWPTAIDGLIGAIAIETKAGWTVNVVAPEMLPSGVATGTVTVTDPLEVLVLPRLGTDRLPVSRMTMLPPLIACGLPPARLFVHHRSVRHYGNVSAFMLQAMSHSC